MANYSVLILTLNEERNLPGCLASAATCDDIVVLDSGSTDRTVTIATEAGARVFERRFDSFAGQRNYAQREIPFRHRWVFHLDADEQFTPELLAACDAISAASASESPDGFYVAPKMLWQGRWLPHCTDYPAWQARFVRAPEFVFVDHGHGQREAPGLRMARLPENYLHNMSAGGEEDWLRKHRRYAIAEAQQALNAILPSWRVWLSGDPLDRRRALKSIAARLPARPALRFLYQYVLRGGFLDGPLAWHYCRLLARYERFTVEELKKLRRQFSKT
jgi:glycosyltransferase involved in cell wall biosynthesis